jgi:putative nucleotidyltransferase with HDIG domain
MNNAIPDKGRCHELMERYQMPEHIREHCTVVCQVALALAKGLNAGGETLNLAAIEAAALLHDITKSNSIHTRENHAETAARLLHSLGYARIAAIVNAHVSLPLIDNSGGVTEEEVVNYADKRVQHTAVVSLDQRFADLMSRYGRDKKSANHILQLKAQTSAIEKKIFPRLHLSPSDLPVLLDKYSC